MAKKFDRQNVLDHLNEKGVNRPCHRCGNNNFSVIDGFSSYYIVDDYGKTVLGGPNVPVVLTACNNCGAITPHAVGALIGIEKNDEVDEKGKEVKND